MAYDPSAPPCPRCGTPFPLTAHVCRNCGLTQEVAQDPFWRSDAVGSGNPPDNTYNVQPPYGPAAQQPYQPAVQPPAAFPPSDPFAHARRDQSYQAYPLGYHDELPPKRSFWRSFGGLSLIAFLLLMVVGVSAFGIYYYPMLCSAQQRNDLPSNIPLPCGITFQDHLDRSASGTTGPGSMEWVYTVDGQSPTQIYTFYQNNLPGDGWKLPTVLQNAGKSETAACQGQSAALINGQQGTVSEGGFTFKAPSGGSVLLIILAPLKNLASEVQQACAAT